MIYNSLYYFLKKLSGQLPVVEDWLESLDQHPKALLENLEAQSGVKRLGTLPTFR